MPSNYRRKIWTNNLQLNSPLFNFISPTNNDKLSDMKKDDLNHFLTLLETYFLEYRYKLGFHKTKTFGVEIEFKKS